jgi:mRNA interferase MazF
VVRGDVCAITLPKGRGHVRHGPRYAVIVQADELLSLSTVLICPTSTSAQPVSFHPEIAIGEDSSVVLCEMAGAVDARAIGEQVGHLSIEELRAVDESLELVLDLA